MNAQTKILILGASNDQIRLIKVAKNLGYYVIDCDYTLTNPGLSFVDKHYQINYLDKDSVLQVALIEDVDGVISNSEQAMPIVAYVSEKLALNGNSVDSIYMLANKLQFRELQKNSGVYYPKYCEIKERENLLSSIRDMSFPIILKPSNCSASRGISKISEYNEEDIVNSYLQSKSYSWSGKVSIEEFVKMPSLRTYEGDIFVLGDDIIWDGIFYTQRSVYAPMIPMTYAGPLDDDENYIDAIKNTLKKLIKGAGIKIGEYNVELYITESNEVFVIEINTRQGGRNLPEFIQQFSGVDMTKLLVTTSVGDYKFFEELNAENRIKQKRYIVHHLIFPHFDGIYEGLYIKEEILKYIITKDISCKYGDYIKEAKDGTGLIGYIDFEFPNQEIRNMYASNMEDYIEIKYKKL